MIRQHWIIGLGVLAVIAIIVFVTLRPLGDSPIPNAQVEPAETVVTAVSNDASAASPVDKSARWGFILFDDVRVNAVPGAPGSAINADMTLFTGDQVYIGEANDGDKSQVKVTLFDGKSGWIENSKVFEATTFAPWNILDTSTAPLKEWIPEELVVPANIAQYRIVISSDFLMRASKNPNPAIAEWAQAVLLSQAERAAQ